MQKTITVGNHEYMYRLSVNQGGVVTRIYTPASTDFLDLTDLCEINYTKELQGYSTYYDANEHDHIIHRANQTIIIEDSTTTRLRQIRQRTYILSGPINERGFCKRIKYLVYTLAEKSRQIDNRQCTLHAAGVATSDETTSVLILGDKGSGKTLTTYALCRLYGMKLIGDDLVIIGNDDKDNLYLHGGTTAFTLRRDSAEQYFPEMRDLLRLTSRKSTQCTIPYEDKVVISPDKALIDVCMKVAKIALVVRISIHILTSAGIVSGIVSKFNEALRLHENLARHIRGQTTPLYIAEEGDTAGYLSSQDTQQAAEIRQRMIVKILGCKFVYVSASSPQHAAELVKSTLGHLE